MVVAKAAAQADVELLALDVVLERVVQLLDKRLECTLKRRQEAVGIVQQAVGVLAVVRADVVDVHHKPPALLGEHRADRAAVVGLARLVIEKLYKGARAVLEQVVVERRHIELERVAHRRAREAAMAATCGHVL